MGIITAGYLIFSIAMMAVSIISVALTVAAITAKEIGDSFMVPAPILLDVAYTAVIVGVVAGMRVSTFSVVIVITAVSAAVSSTVSVPDHVIV